MCGPARFPLDYSEIKIKLHFDQGFPACVSDDLIFVDSLWEQWRWQNGRTYQLLHGYRNRCELAVVGQFE